jgi:hypothetical protein
MRLRLSESGNEQGFYGLHFREQPIRPDIERTFCRDFVGLTRRLDGADSRRSVRADPAAPEDRARSAPRLDPLRDLDVGDRSVITLLFQPSTELA